MLCAHFWVIVTVHNAVTNNNAHHDQDQKRETMEQSAVGRISELLRHQDDLDNIGNLRTKLQKEKAVVDGQLKAGVQAQIGVTVKGTESLSNARSTMESIRSEMQQVDRLREESVESVPSFGKINRLSRVLQNFEQTQKFLDNFRNMSEQLNEIQSLMDADGQFDLDSPMENLVVVHYLLSGLRDVQDDARFHAQRSTDDVRRTINKHFAPLDQAVERFDSILFEIAEALLEVVRAGNRPLAVRVAKIIEAEEKADLAAEISADMDTQRQDSVLGSLQAKTSNRAVRRYPARFFEAIESATNETFSNCTGTFTDDVDELLDNMDWVFNDLELARLEVARCVPSRWRIFDRYVQVYHKQAHTVLKGIVESEGGAGPAAATLLHVLDYVKDYYEKMAALGVPKDSTLLTPPLLDGKEDVLYDEYLGLIVDKLREWRRNLASTEKDGFANRSVAPRTDADGKLALEGEVVMFSIVSQQVDVAADSGRGRVLAGCVEECSRLLRERQTEWENVMKEQVELQIQDSLRLQRKDSDGDDTEGVPGGLVEYLIALANDQIRGADYTEAIASRVAPLVSKKYRTQITGNLDGVSDGFIALAKKCITGLISIIFTDLGPAFSQLFGSSSWYKGKPSRQIVDTIQEYLVDCAEQLNAVIFDVFIDDLIEESVLRYVGALAGSPGSLKIPKASDQIKRDIEMFYDLFTSHSEYGAEPEHVQSQFRVFEHLLAALESPPEELPERFQELRDDFWDAPLDLFEKMVRARKDIDAKRVKEIMVRVRADALQNQQSPPQSLQSTYLSRFQAIGSKKKK